MKTVQTIMRNVLQCNRRIFSDKLKNGRAYKVYASATEKELATLRAQLEAEGYKIVQCKQKIVETHAGRFHTSFFENAVYVRTEN